jgi:UDP-GlcNAc:undecaprenyl-phosphate/decaprenyl-phosphate GlcNAc-1-phosphate transferase
MLINFVTIFLGAFLLNLLFTVVLKKTFLKYGLLLSKGIPLIGGIAVGVSFVLVSLTSFLIYGGLPKEVLGILVSCVVMLGFGVADDRWELSIIAKFIAQAVAISFLIILGVRTEIIYIGLVLNILITLFWVSGITNAFNHLDIVDGLAGGVAAIVSLTFLILAILGKDLKVAILSLALSGAVCSFLLYNLPPAKIYMGNAGSHLLGFVLAAIALVISYAPMERKIALLSPLLILGLPIFDTVFLIIMRIAQERSIFKKSDDHLALRFLKNGHSKHRALLVMLGLCSAFCIFGILLSRSPNYSGALIVAFVGISSMLLMVKITKAEIHV